MQGSAGGLVKTLMPLTEGRPSWEWQYKLNSAGAIVLEYQQSAAAEQALLARTAAAQAARSSSHAGYATAGVLAGVALEEDDESEYLVDYLIQDVSSWIM